MPERLSTEPIEPTGSKRVDQQERLIGQKLAVAQEASELNMIEVAEEAFNPVAMQRRMTSLEQKMKERIVKEKTAETEDKLIKQIEEISETYERRNPELRARTLQMLAAKIKGNESAEEMIETVMEIYPDHFLADEALDFLAQAKTGDAAKQLAEAKAQLNESFGREIRAGRNITEQALKFSQEGLGTPTGLRDLYRDITGNPRPANLLFDELANQFSYEKMKPAIDFFLHSLGADLKSKGPSIGRAELHRLMSEGRNLMAILWVFRFFKGRMNLIDEAFQRAGLLMPGKVTFELLAKLFVQFLGERYPSMDKVLHLAAKLGISTEELAQIILFTQMRDAVRGVAPKLFRSEQHRHDVLMSFLEALEELEDQIEKREEEEKAEPEEEE